MSRAEEAAWSDSPESRSRAACPRVDFGKFIRDVMTRHRPRTDYAGLPAEELLFRLVVLRSTAREIVIRIVDAPDADPHEVVHKAIVLACDPALKQLEMLYARWPRLEPLHFLVWLWCEEQAIYREIRVRLPKLSRVLARVMSDHGVEGDLLVLLRALWVSEIDSYRPAKESSEDLRGVAIEGMWGYLRAMQHEVSKSLTVRPEIPLNAVPVEKYLPPPCRVWNWPKLCAWELAEAWREFLPMVRGKTEKLPEKARQHLRDHFEKWEAQKREGKEVQFVEEPRPDGSDAREFRELADVVRRRSPDADTILEAHLLCERLPNEKAQRFVGCLSAGATVKEACESAGISRPTGYKISRELKRQYKTDP